MTAWINNRPVEARAAPFDLSDRGLLLGDGLFDTALVIDGVVVYRDAHLSRLYDACQTVAIGVARDRLSSAMSLAAEGLSTGVVRVTVTRGPGPRGVAPREDAAATVIASNAVLAPNGALRSVTLWPSSIRRNEMSPSSRLKTLGYLDTVLATKEAQDQGFDEPLFVNTRGRVACAGTGNVFMLKGQTLVTPSLEEGIMPGVIRAAILRLSAEVGLSARENPLELEELIAADGAFVTNSLKIVAPVTSIGAHPVSRRGNPLLARVAAAICADAGRASGVDVRRYFDPSKLAKSD